METLKGQGPRPTTVVDLEAVLVRQAPPLNVRDVTLNAIDRNAVALVEVKMIRDRRIGGIDTVSQPIAVRPCPRRSHEVRAAGRPLHRALWPVVSVSKARTHLPPICLAAVDQHLLCSFRRFFSGRFSPPTQSILINKSGIIFLFVARCGCRR